MSDKLVVVNLSNTFVHLLKKEGESGNSGVISLNPRTTTLPPLGSRARALDPRTALPKADYTVS